MSWLIYSSIEFKERQEYDRAKDICEFLDTNYDEKSAEEIRMDLPVDQR